LHIIFVIITYLNTKLKTQPSIYIMLVDQWCLLIIKRS